MDFLAPDIYFEFKKWCAAYDRPDNPLFIPETSGGYRGAASIYYLVGQHAAIGSSPFAIESAEYSADEDDALARSYDVLGTTGALLLEHQTLKEVAGVVLGELTPSQDIRLGDYTLHVTGSGARRAHPGGSCFNSDVAR